MGIKFGDIDANQILENEFRIGVLERILDFILENNSNLIRPTKVHLDGIRKQTADLLKMKYPNSGIEYKKPE